MISAFGTQLLVTSTDAMKASLTLYWKVSYDSDWTRKVAASIALSM